MALPEQRYHFSSLDPNDRVNYQNDPRVQRLTIIVEEGYNPDKQIPIQETRLGYCDKCDRPLTPREDGSGAYCRYCGE